MTDEQKCLEWLKNRRDQTPMAGAKRMFGIAISALEKQEWHNARKEPPKRPDNMWDTYYVYTRFDRYGIAKYYAHGKWDGYDEDGDQIGEYEIIAYCNFKPYTEEES